MLFEKPRSPLRPSCTGLRSSCSSSCTLTLPAIKEVSTGVMTSPAAEKSCGSSDVAVVDEWESEGYEDIRSMTRCGGSMSYTTVGSERSEEGERGEWKDMMMKGEVER